jgi:hypothetical protein
MLGRLYQIIAVGVLFSGCIHTLEISTTPKGVQVYALKPDGEQGKLLGKTPVVLQSTSDEDYFHLKLAKRGYISRVFLLPFYRPANGKEEVKITLKAQNKEWFQNALRVTYYNQTDALIKDFLSFQENIIQENDLECMRYIESLGKSYSEIATYHSLVGAYFWKKNRLNDARKAYLRLLELVPTDTEAKSMLKAIDAML